MGAKIGEKSIKNTPGKSEAFGAAFERKVDVFFVKTMHLAEAKLLPAKNHIFLKKAKNDAKRTPKVAQNEVEESLIFKSRGIWALPGIAGCPVSGFDPIFLYFKSLLLLLLLNKFI